MTVAVAPPWYCRMLRVSIVTAFLFALPVVAIFALFAIGGMSHVDARALSPDGRLEARAERQGGSMQFPSTAIYVRREIRLFEASAPDCLVMRWSADDSGRDSGPVGAVTLRWREARTLSVGADVPPPPVPGRPCGIRVETFAGSK